MTKTEKLNSIIAGWSYLLWRDPEVEKIATVRANICASCDKLNKASVCIECTCYIPAKVRSIDEKCKIGKW